MSNVAIAGAFMTRFGENWDKGLRDITSEALFGLIEAVDRNFDVDNIEAIYVGNNGSQLFSSQSQLGAIAASCLHRHIPSIRIEADSASGSAALLVGIQAIKSGVCETVVVLGTEKMTDITAPSSATSLLSASLDEEWETQYGQTLAGAWAMIARAHMTRYSTTREHLAAVVVKNHKNGALNPNAQFRREVSMEAVLRAGMVAEPLGLLDCAPTTDGAAALVLASEKAVKEYTDTPVWVLGSGLATDNIALHARESIDSLPATKIAAKKAFKRAKKKPKDIKVAEVHDSFSIGEIIALEDIGFYEPGSAGQATLEGETSLNGNISINTSGGLKARGNPLGATGVAQAVELFLQLRNEAIGRQIQDAEIGLSQNVAGTGGTSLIHILSTSINGGSQK